MIKKYIILTKINFYDKIKTVIKNQIKKEYEENEIWSFRKNSTNNWSNFEQREGIYTQSGGMAWQTEGIKMSTNARGGVMKSLGRMFTGESIFMSTYTAEVDDSKVASAATVSGDIIPINVSQLPEGIILQKRAFLCAEENISLKVELMKKFSAGLFGGEGFILQRASGNGMLF